jgi:hypothetical protein
MRTRRLLIPVLFVAFLARLGHRASDIDSLRLFVNFDYLTVAPVKLGVSCAVGVVMGAIGGSLGQLAHRRIRHIIVSIPNSGFHHGLLLHRTPTGGG